MLMPKIVSSSSKSGVHPDKVFSSFRLEGAAGVKVLGVPIISFSHGKEAIFAAEHGVVPDPFRDHLFGAAVTVNNGKANWEMVRMVDFAKNLGSEVHVWGTQCSDRAVPPIQTRRPRGVSVGHQGLVDLMHPGEQVLK